MHWLALQEASAGTKSGWALLPHPVMRAEQRPLQLGHLQCLSLPWENSFLTRSETQQFPLTGNKHPSNPFEYKSMPALCTPDPHFRHIAGS